MYNTIADVKPQKGKQEAVMEMLKNQEVDFMLMGGARMGGKSEMITMSPLYFIDDPSFRAIYFRREVSEIMGSNGLWEKAENIFPLFGAKSNSTAKRWDFPSRARVFYSHMYQENDKISHRGKGYSAVFFDEIDQFSKTQVQFLQTCLRSEARGNSFMVGTLNPNPDSWCLPLVEWYLNEDGSPDQSKFGKIRYFVVNDKEQFIFADTEEWFRENTPDLVHVTFPNEDGTTRQVYVPPKRFTYCFFNIFDNPKAMEANPRYLSELNNLPKHERDTQLYGNWYSRPKGSNHFDRKWLMVEDRLPPEGLSVRAHDLASEERSEKNRYPDPSGCIGMKKGVDNRFYIFGDYTESYYDDVDQIYGNIYQRVGKRDKAILDQANKDGDETIILLPVDPSAAGKYTYEVMAEKFGSEGYRVKPDPIPTNKSKLTKFLPFCDAASNGLVYIVKSTFDSNTYDFIMKQLEAFDGERSTAKRHDEFVDCIALGYNYLNKTKVHRAVRTPRLSGKSSTPYSVLKKSMR